MPTTIPTATLVAARLRAARERAGMSQPALATAMGFEHRQTLTSIEAGERKLSAEELLKAIEVLQVDLDYFTDAFRLVGEGEFSFRAQSGVSAGILDQFEDRAGRWIATWRQLGEQQGEASDFVQLKLALDKRCSFEQADAAAESLSTQWDLGSTPARSLQRAMEEYLRALVLHVDAPPGISGAASQLPGLNTVLVNRNEPPGRRNFDLAHECFHVLTWDKMPPNRLDPDVPWSGKANRVEQLANRFAAALLMPAAELNARWLARNEQTDIHEWLNGTAADFQVSAVALKWRLHNCGRLSKADLVGINDQWLAANGQQDEVEPAPRAFSERFVKRIASALDAGRLSTRRAASLLALPLSGLVALLQSYGIEPSFEA